MGLIELAQIARLRPLEEVIAEFSQLAGTDVPPKQPGAPARPAAVPAQPRPAATPPAPAPQSATRAPAVGGPVGRTPSARPSGEAPAPVIPVSAPPAAQLPEGVHDPRELVMRISAHVRKESLESILQAISGAELQGDALLLDLGQIGDFYRRQIRENIPLITQAASEVLGRQIIVRIGGPTPQEKAPEPVNRSGPSGERKPDVLERAKKQGAVQSFLEVFPGPVKAEEIDS
jgi:hypothetical protein